MDNNPPIPQPPTTIFKRKRKRTKRQRPTTNATATHASTSYKPLNSSPPSYSDFPTTTEEDEDTANCLILLSKGHNIISSPIEVYVYECKTCSRTFSSFQALGGHRASHTKPTSTESDQPKPSPTFSNPPQVLLNHNLSLPRNTNKLTTSKLHQCSICGAEFNSGQALGGHMRRHRAANTNTVTMSATVTATNTTLSLIPYGHVVVDEHDDQKSTDNGLCLNLDLNLPPPLESNGGVSRQDQHRESCYEFLANRNKQQQSVHLSVAPTLVDCYY